MKLELVQPSLRREWELRREGEVVGRLRLPVFRRGASVELGTRELEIARVGGLRSAHAVRDRITREELVRQRGGKVDLGGRTLEWKRLGRKEGHGFVGPEEEVLVRVKISSGLLHTNGEAETGAIAEQDALVLAVLGSYLLIRKAEDDAAAAAAATSATASTS